MQIRCAGLPDRLHINFPNLLRPAGSVYEIIGQTYLLRVVTGD